MKHPVIWTLTRGSTVTILAITLTWSAASASTPGATALGKRVDGATFSIDVSGLGPTAHLNMSVYSTSGAILCKAQGLSPAAGLFVSDGRVFAQLVIPRGRPCGPSAIRWILKKPSPVTYGRYPHPEEVVCLPSTSGLVVRVQTWSTLAAKVTGHVGNVLIASGASGAINPPPGTPAVYEEARVPLWLICAR